MNNETEEKEFHLCGEEVKKQPMFYRYRLNVGLNEEDVEEIVAPHLKKIEQLEAENEQLRKDAVAVIEEIKADKQPTPRGYRANVLISDEDIDNIVAPYRKTIEQLKEEVEQLKAGVTDGVIEELTGKIESLYHLRDELQKQIEMAYGSFASERERDAYNAFAKKHAKCMKGKANAGKIPYIMEDYVGVGVCKKVVCQVCGKSDDITDIDVW